ncbi:MAG: hypothetical protein RR350_00710 [Oscillibacter sp.]
MKKNRWVLRAAGLMALCIVANVTISLAAEVGSSEDPLVTLSYLNETYLTQILKKVDEKLAVRNADIVRQLGGSGSGGGTATDTFAVATLTKGQTLTGDIGCEVMLRVGSAVCVSPSNPGLIDESSGGTLNGGGALTQNHLYMMTIEGRGVKATAATVKVLVRGSYTIA